MPSFKNDVNPGVQLATAGLLFSDKDDHNLTASSADTPENPGSYQPYDCSRCARWRRVPLELAGEAQEKSAVTHIDRAVRCQLSAHDEGEHFGLLTDTGAYGTALWLRWHGPDEAELVVLLDCPVPAPGPDGDGCRLFIGHATHHTWQDALGQAPYAS
ncbi:hypothetical protein ACFWGE_13920 [Streptomyces bacillaris]|uniref:hypothetical protein n=1 Tax=Streptomyces TaxID=1883 RepID=UPI0026857275|nr:hypothetical protein [Streptomyces sp. KAI-26]